MASTKTPSSNMDDAAMPAATLECVCGKVVVSLAGGPVNRLECCCMDCRYGLQWSHQNKGGPPLSTPYAELMYFPNWFNVQQGQQFLDVYMIKEGYNTQRIVTSCCGTVLLGDHPFYQGKQLVSYIPPSVLTLLQSDTTKLMPPQRRIFKRDLTEEELEELEPFVPPSEEETVHHRPGMIELASLQRQFPTGYTTIQDLIASLGPLQYMNPDFEGVEPEWNKMLAKMAAEEKDKDKS